MRQLRHREVKRTVKAKPELTTGALSAASTLLTTVLQCCCQNRMGDLNMWVEISLK